MRYLMLSLFFGIAFTHVRAGCYFRKNIIILVDQSPEVQGDENSGTMRRIYNFLKASLTGGTPAVPNDGYSTDLSIDPEKDQVTIYGFGLKGCGNILGQMAGDYAYIHSLAMRSAPPQDVCDSFVRRLIYKYGSLHEGNDALSLEDLIRTKMAPAFGIGGHTLQANAMLNRYISGTTLSYYVYPMILDPYFMGMSKASCEYIIIVVTNYQNGVDDMGTSLDKETLKEMLGEKVREPKRYYDQINRHLSRLSRPFYKIPVVEVNFGNKMLIDGYQLGLKALSGVSSYMTSNLELHETASGKTTYDVGEVSISFNKDRSVSVDSILMEVQCTGECLYSDNVLPDAKFNENTKVYELPARRVDLKKVFGVGDALTFRYLLFTSTEDERGGSILPIVFTAEREYTVTEETLISPEEQKRKMIITVIICILAAVAIAAILWYVRKRRGESRKTSIKFTIWPLTHDHFMEVEGNKVSSYDCWYWSNGRRDINIPVSGTLEKEDKAFASHCHYSLEAKIEDIDDNDDFSFRADPDKRDSRGNITDKNVWYEVPLASNGDFSFNVNAYLVAGRTEPNFKRPNILKVKVSVRCVMGEGEDKKCFDPVIRKYTFVVKEPIDNRNIWIAFDPGTTGSCVAFGVSGNPTDNNDIYLAQHEYETLDGEKRMEYIFPSMIRIMYNSPNLPAGNDGLDASNFDEGRDFLFGNAAAMMWDPEGVNCFQSIKKLLGYTDKYEIVHVVNGNAQKKSVDGRDIAHLLVKGLYKHVGNYIMHDASVKSEVRDMFCKESAFCPQRAIVAVPNNYTIVKVQEMVDTVKRLNKFREVHYIYEAEAVMMMYFRQCWKDLPQQENRLFVVYDMGGATINITAFRIRVTQGQKAGNNFIRRIELETIAKIGYAVGGDDLDFALIQILYNVPSVHRVIEDRGVDVPRQQQQYKAKLIDLVRQLKLEIIDKEHDELPKVNHLTDAITLYGHIKSKLGEITGLEFDNDPSEEDKKYLESIIDTQKLRRNKYLENYVYSNVEDAVNNLLSSLSQYEGIISRIELVMSGRSILFPGVQALVEKTMTDKKYVVERWNGFDNDRRFFSHEKVKTAVATGACWYAMYSDYIKLVNDKVTSTFGYIDMIDNQQKFVPVIKRNSKFNEDNYIEETSSPRSNLADVKFIQMLSAETDYDKVWKEDIRHKYNILDQIRPSEMFTNAETITMRVDDCGNFSYKVWVQGGRRDSPLTVESNQYSRLANNTVQTEIKNENSESYIFSTTNWLKCDDSVVDRFLIRIWGTLRGPRRF